MRLFDLLSGIVDRKNVADVEIAGITSDSRKVKPSYLFVALSETANCFIPQALDNMAAAIIASNYSEINNCISVRKPKEIYHRLAARFYKNQPSNIVAVTGTNGKTSVVNFCQQLWNSANLKSVSIGTVGVLGDTNKEYKINLTTPDAADTHSILNGLKNEEVEYIAIEASSHGLDQYRIHSVDLCAAAFTNISQDHYDYHNNFESYFQKKKKLFSEILRENGTVILNSDIAEFQELLCCVKKQKVISYGKKSQDIKLVKQVPKNNGQTISLNINGDNQEVFLPILGKFQAYNIMCAIGLVIATSVENFHLELLRSVDGRMQLIDKNNCKVVVDYAHTPDALKSALISLRWHIDKGRIILVFGCGGDRDKRKRSIMGQIANDYADVVIVCDDNPRTENPDLIRKEIISNCNKAIKTNISNRKQAIIAAINEAKADDIILVAGKGHEKNQIIGSNVIPFSDFLTINSILS